MSESTKLTEILGSSQLQALLTQFNIIDTSQIGVITIDQAMEYFQRMNLPDWDDGVLRTLLLTSPQITFDEFLALLYQVQKINNCQKVSHTNHRLVEFLQLLQDYRQKCELEQNYIQANKCYKKSQEIIQKQVRREESLLREQQRLRLEYISSMEKDKIVQFNLAWRSYYEEFEEEARRAIEDLRFRQQVEMQSEAERIRRELMRPRETRALKQMKEQEKLLVRLKSYDKAEKVKDQFRKLQVQESKHQSEEILKKILQKTENLRKRQESIVMAQMRKIDISRDLHKRREKLDAQKLSFKLKKLKDQIYHEEVVQHKNSLNRIKGELLGRIDRKRKFKSVEKILPRKKGEGEYNPEYFRPDKTKASLRIRVNSFNRPRFQQDTSVDDI